MVEGCRVLGLRFKGLTCIINSCGVLAVCGLETRMKQGFNVGFWRSFGDV